MGVQRIHTLNQRSLFQIAYPSGGKKKVLLSLGFINMDQVGSKSKKLLNRHTHKVGKNAKQSLKLLLYFKCKPEGNKTEKRKGRPGFTSKQGYLIVYTNQVPERSELFKSDEQSAVL